jgi:hypothetical protein
MSMGKRKREQQPVMWITTTDLPTTASGELALFSRGRAEERSGDALTMSAETR